MNVTEILCKGRRTSRRTRRQSGSTLILVLVILSILALIATTLSFTSRLEVISSGNFAEGTQARMSAATGVETAAALLPLRAPYTAYTQRWALQGEIGLQTSAGDSPLADVTIVDESSKLNINAADDALLRNALATILKTHRLNPGVAPAIASEIIRYRYGPDGKPGAASKDDDGDSSFSDLLTDGLDNDCDSLIDNPEEVLLSVEHDGIDNNQDGQIDDGHDGVEFDGLDNDGDGVIDEKFEGIDEPDEFIPDPTRTPNGDDRPFLSVEELKLLPSMTDEIFNALKPYVTVYSVCDPVYSNGGQAIAKVNANAASAQEIYEALARRFHDRDTNLLKQFAVNVADARDADSVPTSLSGESPQHPFLGIEKTPYINEVWSDSLTDAKDGDDGQYIELFNPYDEAISIEGWRMEVAGSSVYLTGNIAPRGYVVITDDYNNENDPTPEDDESGYGSLYDIFGVVRGGSARRIVEKGSLEIPDDSGTVILKDRRGKLIDYFYYKDGQYKGVRVSFQRDDPRVRYATKTFCTPLKQNLTYRPSSGKFNLTPFHTRDRLFESPVDLMDVFAGYTNVLCSKTSSHSPRAEKPWSAPLISSADAGELDIRLVDIFTVKSRTRLSASKILQKLGRVDEDDLYRLLERQNTPGYIYGQVNINTAPAGLIAAIPGLDETFAQKLTEYRYQATQIILRGENDVAGVPFENITDIMRFATSLPKGQSGLKDTSRAEILESLRKVLPYITVQSRSFMVYSESRFGRSRRTQGATPKQERQPARSIVKALLRLTPRGNAELVNWCYLTR